MSNSPTEPGERLFRPASLLDWWQVGDELRGGPYRIRLIEPHRWEISRDGIVVAEEPTRSSSLHRAELHHREVLRRRDIVVWSGVILLSVAAVAALAEWVERATIVWVGVLALAMFVGVSGVVRLVAALTGSRHDPYRRKAPWEKRRRWWHRWSSRRRPDPPA